MLLVSDSMKNVMRRMALLVALCVMTLAGSYAQGASPVAKKVDEIVKKYDETKGVDCVTVVKGRGLEMFKMMFNKEFGKDFMKGVTSITVIDYSDASEEVCKAIRKDLDAFVALLEEFKLGKEKQFADNDYIRSFARVTESGALSDFVIALENKEAKTIMYMAGEIKVE